MGNCLDAASYPNGQIYNARQDIGVSITTKVHPVWPPRPTLQTGGKLKSDHQLSELASSPRVPQKMVSGDNMLRCRSMKLVVTKKQLGELLKIVKEHQSKGITVQFAESAWEKEGSPRWRPSLASIPE